MDNVIDLRIDPEIQNHPLLRETYFYIVPSSVLGALVDQIGEGAFDPDVYRVDRSLSALPDSDPRIVGLWRGTQTIMHPHLRPLEPLDLPHGAARLLGRQSLADVQRRLNERMAWLTRDARGYCGWLLTDPTFLREHDLVLQQYAGLIRSYGLPHPTLALTHDQMRGARPVQGVQEFGRAMAAFCSRWRLSHLAGPYLPVPQEPLFPVPGRNALQSLDMDSGATIFLPDTYSIPSRDMLRDMLEDLARNRRMPEHLADWMALVSRGNPARNQIERYGHIFEVQHFWWLILSRHAGASRKAAPLRRALARFLGVTDLALRRDLQLVAGRLGQDWWARRRMP